MPTFDDTGLIDLLLSCGDWLDKTRSCGLRLYRNLGCTTFGSSIAVYLGHSNSRRCTQLHTKVRVKVRSVRGVIMHRLGKPGTVSTCYSYRNIAMARRWTVAFHLKYLI